MALTISNLRSGLEDPSSQSLNHSLRSGDHLTLSGRSGCGKSSLLLVLAGLLPIESGSFQWQGRDITVSNLAWWRQQFCYLPQTPVMGVESETIQDALCLPWTMHAMHTALPTVAMCLEALDSVGLAAALNHNVETLSGGEKQRVAIARALLTNRPLWLLDEPTSALDPQSRDHIMMLLRRLRVTRVSVSHDPVWLADSDHQHTIEAVA